PGANGSSAASIAQAFAQTVTAGNLVVIGLSCGNYGSTTPVTVAVTMNGLGNTPVVAVARDYIVGVGGTVHVALYYLVVATGGTLTVTVTPSVTTYSAITIDEYLFTGGPAIATDGFSTKTGSSATPTAGTIVPSGTELVYG